MRKKPPTKAELKKRRVNPSSVKKAGDVFTTGQIAKMCKVAPKTVSGWIDRGVLSGYRMPAGNIVREKPQSGGDRRVHRSDLIRFLTENKMTSLLANIGEHLCRVLLVGTSEAFADAVKGRTVGTATVTRVVDIFDAGSALRDHWDIVLVDFAGLGRADGMRVGERAKDKAANVIAVTGEDEVNPPALAAAGFKQQHFPPFDPDTLVGMVAQFADRMHRNL